MTNRILTLDFIAASYDIAPNGQLSLTSLMKYLQQAAHKHSTDLKVGFYQLKERNIFWVLSGITVQVNQLPSFDEPFTIETWPRENMKLFSIRDFLVFKDNNIVAKVTSSWLMVDLNSKRPVRPEQLLAGIDFLPAKHAFDVEELYPDKIEHTNLIEARMVRFSDLDINRHVNNTRYLEWIMDAIHKTSYKDMIISGFSIRYAREFVEGEIANIYFDKLDNNRVLNIEITHNEGKTGIAAVIEFKL